MQPQLVVFNTPEFYRQRHNSYQIAPVYFSDLDEKILAVNEVGEHLLLKREEFDAFISGSLPPNNPVYKDLKAKHLLFDTPSDVPIRLLAAKYRTKRAFLSGFIRLHIFVVSLRCDHSCHYCQVSRVSTDRQKFDMSKETAQKALDLIFRCPANELKLEFQGGEPLLNFDLIRFVIEEAKRRNEGYQKNLQFVVTTNLAFVTDDILNFMKANDVLVSTSLDGPAFIHNSNRPRPGNNSYELTIEGIRQVREALGYDRVSPIMTTTRLSLDHPEAIVDEYVSQGFNTIFLRPISPYGFALKTQHKTGYELDRFLTFYKRALAHIIELNRRGIPMMEAYSQLILKKILTPFATGYVDLQSPAGAGIGVVVYNYDGEVYPTDEARMLVEMGDRTFRLGNVHSETYEQLFGGETLRTLVASSCVESLPLCSDCAYQTYCGCDPVENHATQGNIFGNRPSSNFHKRNFEIISHLFRLYYGEDIFVRKLFWSWVQNCGVNDLLPSIES